MWKASPLLYVAYVCGARALLTPARKAALLRHRRTYNLASSAASLAFFVVSLRLVRAAGFGVCAPPPPAPHFAAAWYVSKYGEWADTLLLLAADKPITWLHYNHHMSTAFLVGAQMRAGRSSSRSSVFDAASCMNAGVHVCMYAYYAFPGPLQALRRIITRLQIAQHASVLLLLAHASWRGDCDVDLAANAVAAALYAMYLTQFVVFFLSARPAAKKKM